MGERGESLTLSPRASPYPLLQGPLAAGGSVTHGLDLFFCAPGLVRHQPAPPTRATAHMPQDRFNFPQWAALITAVTPLLCVATAGSLSDEHLYPLVCSARVRSLLVHARVRSSLWCWRSLVCQRRRLQKALKPLLDSKSALQQHNSSRRSSHRCRCRCRSASCTTFTSASADLTTSQAHLLLRTAGAAERGGGREGGGQIKSIRLQARGG